MRLDWGGKVALDALSIFLFPLRRAASWCSPGPIKTALDRKVSSVAHDAPTCHALSRSHRPRERYLHNLYFLSPLFAVSNHTGTFPFNSEYHVIFISWTHGLTCHPAVNQSIIQ